MVKKVITNFDSSKTYGPHCIPVVVLKNCEPECSYILAELFNIYLKESCFPDCWKVSLVATVFNNVGKGIILKTTPLLVFFLWLVKSFKNLFLLFSVIDGFRWFWMGSLHKNIQLMLEFLKGPFLVLHFSYYILMNFLMLSVILLWYNFYSKCDQASDLWQQLQLASELESDLRDTVDWGRKWLVDFNAGKTQLVWFDQSYNTGAIGVKMDGSVLEEKSSFRMLGLTFSSKLGWGSYSISIAKTASKKIGALIHSVKFLSPKVALLCISINLLWDHAWNTVAMSGLVVLVEDCWSFACCIS